MVLKSGTGHAKLAVVLGIRPDLIRASLVLRGLQERRPDDVVFIWSGQHYSDNLKDVFLRELAIAPPAIELGASGTTDAEVVSSVIARLSVVLADLEPRAVVFLGDTNTVMGCLAAAQLNIPIVHIEGCMRSYDWRMPEEKYRTTIDHLSDVIYAYFEEYKAQGVAEGLNPANIVVVQNLIVDVLDHYYFARLDHFRKMVDDGLLTSRGLEPDEFLLMTCHRRENVEHPDPLRAIMALAGASARSVWFPASYRTQTNLRRFEVTVPPNVTVVDPIGYDAMLALMTQARGVLTDSGTVVEETAVLGVPSVQMRRATERPQVYDCRSSVKFDPSRPNMYPHDVVFQKLESLVGTAWQHGLGDGHASDRIVNDLLTRLETGTFDQHRPEQYAVSVTRAYREDDL
ncbi:MAG: UDP-N-acetylglucosamine 2-epimerase [Acidimicrobiia bacterium]